jgi:hypothetical protein
MISHIHFEMEIVKGEREMFHSHEILVQVRVFVRVSHNPGVGSRD